MIARSKKKRRAGEKDGELAAVDEAHDNGSSVHGCADKGSGAIVESPFSLRTAPSSERISDAEVKLYLTAINQSPAPS